MRSYGGSYDPGPHPSVENVSTAGELRIKDMYVIFQPLEDVKGLFFPIGTPTDGDLEVGTLAIELVRPIRKKQPTS